MMKTIIPISLSDVICKNHHQLQLSCVMPLNAKYLEDDMLFGYPQGTISGAHMICFNWNPDRNTDPPKIHILGWHEEMKMVYITSRLEVIKPDYKLVQTQSESLYEIASYGDGKILERDLAHLCAVMHQWRLGEHFDVPKFWY